MPKDANGDAFEDIICSDSQIVNEETANIQSVKTVTKTKEGKSEEKANWVKFDEFSPIAQIVSCSIV